MSSPASDDELHAEADQALTELEALYERGDRPPSWPEVHGAINPLLELLHRAGRAI